MPNPVPVAVEDRALVARVAGGDDLAIGTLYDRYGSTLYAVAYRILTDRADAEEVTIEAFAQAWREATRFEASRGSVAAWLTMIVRSRALDLARARQRRERLTASAAVQEPDRAPAMGRWRADPADSLDHDERRRQVAAALDHLSPVQREAIELAYFEGLSQSEIAERLREPLGTVKTRVRLGMQKLRDALRPWYFEPGHD